MPIVFACIAPHSGNLMRGDGEPTPILTTREAMREMRRLFEAARPDAVALITPHGNVVEGAYSLGATARCAAQQPGVRVEAETDLALVAAWAAASAARGVPVTQLRMRQADAPLPLDWGAYIPLHLLAPTPAPPVAIACPSTALSRPQLIAWGEALVDAADALGRRVAFIVSADQGHGHAADGPYGFAAASAEYDAAMAEAVRADDLPRLLSWDDTWIEAGLVDSYWQTLALIGVQRRVPLRARFLSYEVDHYFGLLCAAFLPPHDSP
jgi:aromatic ring-opening dioxygenase LigB subunit